MKTFEIIQIPGINMTAVIPKRRHSVKMKNLLKYLDDISSKRKTMVSTGDRSAKIRTYNFPQGRMTDHRINLTMYNLNSVMNGELQEIIDKLQMAENAERLKESEIEA